MCRDRNYLCGYYDATLGRFTTMDRFAEKYYSMSPYQYAGNNPVGNIDINGDSIVILNYGYYQS
nr:RHS repeat-associated core domain-containing protein [Bacteroides intestinalis]